jgi:hypothetical protein
LFTFPHLTPVVIDLLSEARVRIVTFAPHITQIVQALDFTLFGGLKRRGQYQLPFGDDIGSAHFIKKVYRDFQSTMTDINIWDGLISSIVDGIQHLSFDERILRESGGFRELWEIDFGVENLLMRRPNARFGWINTPE